MIFVGRKDLLFPQIATVDEAGEVFIYQDRILRAISSEYFSDLYVGLLKEGWSNRLFNSGLVNTWICGDLEIDGVRLILEHERIPFHSLPAEWTSRMHWQAAKTMVRVNLELSQHHYILKDSHPFNIMFHKGYPKFVDFGSIVKASQVTPSWLEEFIRYFGVPIWLASKRRTVLATALAREYRRQHMVGFGLMLFDNPIINYLVMAALKKLQVYRHKPSLFFKKIDDWLDRHEPATVRRGLWADYQEPYIGENPLQPNTFKGRFVLDILSRERPSKMMDCGANRGYFAGMAATLGSAVVAFDDEEFCVDECLRLAQTKNLDITPAMMDFRFPTPNSGLGLMVKSAFERFQADIVLAIGLIHHVCIVQKLPVRLFCDICCRYAKRGVILLYVDPRDRYVMQWKESIPKDYTIGEICKYFLDRFPYVEKSDVVKEDGLYRTFLYFHC